MASMIKKLNLNSHIGLVAIMHWAAHVLRDLGMGFNVEVTLFPPDTEFFILKLPKLVRNYSFICLFPKYLISVCCGSNTVLDTGDIEQAFCF